MAGKYSVTGRGGIVGSTRSGSQISNEMRPRSSSVRIEPTVAGAGRPRTCTIGSPHLRMSGFPC